MHQRLTRPGTGRPVLLAAAPAFVGAAPLRYAPQQLDGYEAHPGLGFWYRFDYPCEDSVSQPGSCGLEGAPAQHAARCSADPGCQVMMDFPDGRDYPGPGAHGGRAQGVVQMGIEQAGGACCSPVWWHALMIRSCRCPGTRPAAGQPVVLLKGGPGAVMNVEDANINLNAVLYKKKATPGGGSSLSAGAIAGEPSQRAELQGAARQRGRR